MEKCWTETGVFLFLGYIFVRSIRVQYPDKKLAKTTEKMIIIDKKNASVGGAAHSPSDAMADTSRILLTH